MDVDSRISEQKVLILMLVENRWMEWVKWYKFWQSVRLGYVSCSMGYRRMILSAAPENALVTSSVGVTKYPSKFFSMQDNAENP